MAKAECCGTLAEALTSTQQNLDGAEEEPSHQPAKKLEAMVLATHHPRLSPLSWMNNGKEIQAQAVVVASQYLQFERLEGQVWAESGKCHYKHQEPKKVLIKTPKSVAGEFRDNKVGNHKSTLSCFNKQHLPPLTGSSQIQATAFATF